MTGEHVWHFDRAAWLAASPAVHGRRPAMIIAIVARDASAVPTGPRFTSVMRRWIDAA